MRVSQSLCYPSGQVTRLDWRYIFDQAALHTASEATSPVVEAADPEFTVLTLDMPASNTTTLDIVSNA